MPDYTPLLIANRQSLVAIQRAVDATSTELQSLRRKVAYMPDANAPVYRPLDSIRRGVTNEAISKGTSDKTVSRYLPGTTTDSGTDDTVTNELINIASGKVVHYFQQTKADGTTVNYITSVECPNT